MGKRAWLSNLIDNDYLPAIALLSDSPQGRAKAQQLAARIRQEWFDRGAQALNQQQSLMDQTRRAIKDQLGEDLSRSTISSSRQRNTLSSMMKSSDRSQNAMKM